MQNFGSEKKAGTSRERVRHWLTEGWVREERGKEWESILGPLLVAKGLLPKVEKFDSFSPIKSGEPSKVMLYLLGLQFLTTEEAIVFFFFFRCRYFSTIRKYCHHVAFGDTCSKL